MTSSADSLGTDLAAQRSSAIELYRSGRYREALERLEHIAETAADYSNLGVILRNLGRHAEAEARYHQAISRNPDLAAAHYNLANLLCDRNRLPEATISFRKAIRRQPSYAEAWNGLGIALQRQGNFNDAMEAFRSATTIRPTWAEAHTNLGVTLLGLARYDDAEAALLQALSIEPDLPSAYGNLGAVQIRAGRPMAAEISLRTAVQLKPGEHRWLTNYAVALEMQTRHAEAEHFYRQAIAIQPSYASGHGNLLFSLNYRTDLAPEEIFAEYQAWDRQHAQPLLTADQRFANNPSPDRQLRIGYVSPDFREHAVALFAEPLLAAHEREHFEIYCYSDVILPDITTTRFRALVKHWHSAVGSSDAELAETIRRDQIDILIDLAGHTANNRLLTFARKPAPVQITYLLGHGYTSGLSAMDAFLADDILAPRNSDTLFSERVVRLPRIPLAYQPPPNMPPVVSLPALTTGHITFGHFGRPERLNDMVITAWARILQELPQSRLVLNSRPFQEHAFRTLFIRRFAAHKIDPSRLDLIFTSPQCLTWAAYGNIDISLDPFPHNAGTTTIEALWQGVPVVSLASRPTVGRFGASILHAIGLDGWITDSIDTYVARAVNAAGDLTALAKLRDELRSRIAASPLHNANDLARAVEQAYRSLWKQWCAGDVSRLQRLYSDPNWADAKILANDILAHDPTNTITHHVLGLIAYGEKDMLQADRHLRAAIAQSPNQAELHANHAAILRSQGKLTEAESAARIALTIEPNHLAAHNNLGNILRDSCRYEESITSYKAALCIAPRFIDAWINLAWVLALAGHAQQAEQAARQATVIDPRNPDGYNNLGLALMRQGRLDAAEAAFRQALALRPTLSLPHSNLLFCMNYRPDVSPEDIFAEYRRWDSQHALQLLPIDSQFELDRTSGRRLRVGYVSPDFRQHAAALFAEPLLAAHDRTAIEIYCYAEVPAPDVVTARFQAFADYWRCTVGLSDAQLAELIRGDHIDILVDLAGHTAGNRLLVFARKPAPVQITYLLGHGYSSGLSAIDAFLADAELAPPGAEALFSERVIRLSRIPIVYGPPTAMPLVASSPAQARGFVTFGYFGRTVRLNEPVVAAWARILHGVPKSRLTLNSAPFAEPAGCDRMADRFLAHGIDRCRLDLVFTSPQERTWAAYGDIDIALDPFPHNAGTTTIEALWLGVPVISLAGRPTVGRFGAAILHAIGLDDWATDSIDAYVARALAAAADLDALAQLRTELRARLAGSALCDAIGLAREIETVYRSLWEAWRCGDEPDMRRRYSSGDLEGAAGVAGRTLACDPDNPAALHILGLVQLTGGNSAAATALMRRSIAARPSATVLSDLGVALRAQNEFSAAEAAYRYALRLDPTLIQPQGNLGSLLLNLGRYDEARDVLEAAAKCAPGQPWLLRHLALSLLACGRTNRAEEVVRQALEVDPHDPELHESLGTILGQTGRPIEAETHHRIALPGLQQPARGFGNLAVALQMQGRHAEAGVCFRQALELRPAYVPAHSNLLFALNYRADLSADVIFDEYRNWDRQHACGLTRYGQNFPRDQLTGRRLRVGYVSADFRQHAVAFFAEPLLAAHDHANVELFCYAEVASPDAVTRRFQSVAEHWRNTAGQSDDEVADMIRHDQIDVLVDLAGHSAGNRLLVFARQPAPVQVAYLLGHGYTTGLSSMDAFLADATLAPPEADSLFSEQIVRLGRIPLAYAPPTEMPPVVPLPSLAGGAVAFGYFGRPERLNASVIAAWSRILHIIPTARLVLNSRSFREAALCDLFAARFAARDISRHRLQFLYTEPQPTTWAAYGEIDVALDPFPHNAGTTTIEALWQGVPVISLAGRPSVGRFGAMILHAIGLDEWITGDIDAYVARAVEAVTDLNALAQLRQELRPRFARSPLHDATGLARAIEATYRMLWDEWRTSSSITKSAE